MTDEAPDEPHEFSEGQGFGEPVEVDAYEQSHTHQ